LFLFCLCFLCFGRLPSGQPKNERKTGIKLVGDSSIDFESNRIESSRLPLGTDRLHRSFFPKERRAAYIPIVEEVSVQGERERERERPKREEAHARTDGCVCVCVRTYVCTAAERKRGRFLVSIRFDSFRDACSDRSVWCFFWGGFGCGRLWCCGRGLDPKKEQTVKHRSLAAPAPLFFCRRTADRRSLGGFFLFYFIFNFFFVLLASFVRGGVHRRERNTAVCCRVWHSLFHSVDSADGAGGVPTGVGTGGEGLGVENGFPVYCVLHRIGSHRIGSHRIGLYGLVIVSFGNGVVW